MRSPLIRYFDNPLLTPADMPFECYEITGAAAVRDNDRVVLLLSTVNSRMQTEFYPAFSDNGIDFTISTVPLEHEALPLFVSPVRLELEKDCRVVSLDGEFYICYNLNGGASGVFAAIGKVEGFRRIVPLAYFPPPLRDATLFSGRVDGRFVRLGCSGVPFGRGGLWLSESVEGKFWGNNRPILLPGTGWNEYEVSPGLPPIETDDGWLTVYQSEGEIHGSRQCYLGVLLLDLHDPAQVIAASRQFIFTAGESYEHNGVIPGKINVCGSCLMADGILNIYYSAANTRVCLAQTTLNDLRQCCSGGDSQSGDVFLFHHDRAPS